MNAGRNRLAIIAARELLLVGLCALGAVVFIQHAALYFTGRYEWEIVPAHAYVLNTALIYAWFRATAILAALRAPKVQAGLVLCPDCGRPYEDGTPEGREAHARVPLTPRPTEREVFAAVALRKAIDDARMAMQAQGPVAGPDRLEIPGDIENLLESARLRRTAREPIVIKRTLKEPEGPRGPR